MYGKMYVTLGEGTGYAVIYGGSCERTSVIYIAVMYVG